MLQTWLGKKARGIRIDRLAIGRAVGLCLFLWLLKVYLGAWYVWTQGINPLESLPWWQVPLLGAVDLVVCAALAGGYALLGWIAACFSSWRRRLLADVVPLLVHVGMVVFAVVSMQVNQIYGWPLVIRHLRAAGQLDKMGSSIAAYVSVVNLVLLALGVMSFFLARWLQGRGLSRLRPLQARWQMWGALGTVTVLLAGGAVIQLRGLYLHGLKNNAVLHFIKYYEPALEPLHVRSRAEELYRQIAGRETDLLRPRSLHVAEPLRRDFTFHGDASQMNVLFIVMESTSTEYLDEQTTPNLMALARTGVSFRNHVTTFSETYKAAYALFYSDYLTELGALPRMAYERPLPQTSIVELAHRRGDATGVFHSGYLDYSDLGYIWENKGAETMVDAYTLNGDKGAAWMWGAFEEATVEALADWIRQRDGRRFFAIHSPMFPHHPYISPLGQRPFPETTWENRYRNALYYADHAVGLLVQSLREQGLLERTLIVVVGDHGETVSRWPVGHGMTMTYEEMRTPFILSNPVLFPEPQESNLFTSHLDVAPTVASLLGLPTDSEWLGRNLLADTIEPRQFFLDIDQARLRAVVDNGLLLSIDDKTNEAVLMEMRPDRLVPLDADDPRQALLPRYLEASNLYVPWAMWRHLSRAIDGAPTAPPAATVVTTSN